MNQKWTQKGTWKWTKSGPKNGPDLPWTTVMARLGLSCGIGITTVFGASYVYDKTTTTKKWRFFWDFSKMSIFTKMIFYQKFDQDYTDFRSPPTRCQLQSFLWKFTKKCNSASSVDCDHRQILSHARSTKNAWQSSKYVRKKSLQIIITCSKSKKIQHLFFLQSPSYYKETKRPAPQAPAARPKNSAAGGEKKIQAVWGPKS